METKHTPIFESWGRTSRHHQIARSAVGFDPKGSASIWLARGLGRAYGDANVCPGGTLIRSTRSDGAIEWDADRGILSAPAGMSLAEVVAHCLPDGWTLPVTPGTKWVTLGGAVAADVHGKNHHRAGTLGCHVRRLTVLRTDERGGACSSENRPELFGATIGGMGLTGLITRVELQLQRVPSAWFSVHTYAFDRIDKFFQQSRIADQRHGYTVAWVDWLRFQRDGTFTGVVSAGDPCERTSADRWRLHSAPLLSIPAVWNGRVTWPFTQALFNQTYRAVQRRKTAPSNVHYDTFFYPLDALDGWNRLYGKKGFYQHQAVFPMERAEDFLHQLRVLLNQWNQPVYLAVVKSFGAIQSPGWLSFPQAGLTTALDLPNRGSSTFRCLEALNRLTIESGGRCYAAKDATMNANEWAQSYPRWIEFKRWIDPGVASGWSKRVGLTKD